MTLKKIVDDEMCSHVWLSPIKTTANGTPKVGLEMEINVYDAETLVPIGTQDAKINPQILMHRLVENVEGAIAVKEESTNLILTVELPTGGNFSLEPGGQIEFSSSACETLSQLIKETQQSLQILEDVAKGEVVFLSHGTNPIAQENHPLVVPKERYQIMTRYFNSAPPGVRGLDMMRHCSTVQANLDVFGDEKWKDAVHLTIYLIPLTRYLFANSFYFKGKHSSFVSERQNVWDKMDPSRSGYPFLDVNTFFEQCPECAYATWGKNAFVFLIESLSKEEQPVFGELTFAQWMTHGYKGTRPTVEDWETHLATLFPHLRLRKFLEVRHIDAQPFEHTFAPIAFFSALTQCSDSRKKTWDLIQSWNLDKHKLFSLDCETYDFCFEPLLNLACEILESRHEFESVKALQAYKLFIKSRKIEALSLSPQDFVQLKSTQKPAQEFMKNL